MAMRNKSGLKPKIGQVVKTDGTLTGNDGETAEVLNNFFHSVFTSECGATEIFPSNDDQLSDICRDQSIMLYKLPIILSSNSF